MRLALLDDPPAIEKQTRSATSRAKPISWVTMTMVMPPAFKSRMIFQHIADQFRIERGGDLVEQQHFGNWSPASGTMATRCCWPPESCSG